MVPFSKSSEINSNTRVSLLKEVEEDLLLPGLVHNTMDIHATGLISSLTDGLWNHLFALVAQW